MSQVMRFRPGRFLTAAVLAMFILCVSAGFAQDFSKYHTYAELTSMLQGMATSHANIAKLQSIGKTLGGKDIWLLEIANPAGVPVKERPALFIGANLEGDHLIGSEIALFVSDFLLKSYPANADVKQRLDNYVIYIVPRINPDGAEAAFGAAKAVKRTNSSPFDGDNDGRLDEDGPEDLNKDGYTTLMRVRDPSGEYIIDPDDKRLMKRADPKKGERGEYKLYWEGIDNDKDDFINEDPVGGTDINRNFMHEYPYYRPEAGLHMVSENETRAVLDFLISHRNIAAVLTFGESDNLIVPTNSSGRFGPAREIDLFRFADASNAEANKVGVFQAAGGFGGRFSEFGGGEMFFMIQGGGGRGQQQPTGRAAMPERRPATTVNAADIDYFKTISDKYIELTGIRQPLMVREPQGALFQYGYYQYGVPSFSTPGWGLATAESGRRQGLPQAGSSAGPPSGGQQGGAVSGAMSGVVREVVGGGPGGIQMDRQAVQRMMSGGSPSAEAGQAVPPGIDRQVLQWMDSEKIEGFVNWTPFKHPDLGDVEIGGFKPTLYINPPAAKIADLGASHAKFALYVSSLFPMVRIAKTEVINHGGGLFRIKAEVENSGFLPLCLAHGVASRSVKPTMVQLGAAPEAFISGNPKTNFIPTLAGTGGRQKFEWLIKGKAGSTLELKVISDKGGTDKAAITLK